MGKYEFLKRESPIPIDDNAKLPKNIKGIYIETHEAKVILINGSIPTNVEKVCILAEELGHYHTSTGDITDQTDIRNRKQELTARQWGYQKLIPLDRFIDVYKARIQERYAVAELLGVTESFLQASVDRYREKYGMYVVLDEQYIIYFDPLGVAEMFTDM